jgi:hypothetical protein
MQTLPLHLIADLQRPPANESGKTLQGHQSVEQLQCIMGVTKDDLCDAQDKLTVEAVNSGHPIDPIITAGAKEVLHTKDLQVTYANINPTRPKLVHRSRG